MNPKAKFLPKGWIYLAAAFALLAASSCTTSPSLNKGQQKPTDQNSATAVNNLPDPRINLNCVIDHLQNPPEAFHYSYKKDGSNFVENEADVTPQTIDGSFKNNSASRPVHGVRSDADSWQMAWSSLTGIAGMASTVALVNNSSSMVREAAEKVNGYDTIRYTIDTARATAEEAALYQNTLGPGGSEKGTVWVTSEGCPVKFSLDSEMHLNNGSVDKVHYEVAMVKK
ncbi:MAG: hypothetical protein WCE61_11710 [Candidatus Acidiferrum sp.]